MKTYPAAWFMLACLILFPASPALTRGYADYEKVTAESGELFGMEIELAGGRSLGGVLALFDFKLDPEKTSLVREKLSRSDVDSYLNPITLDALPPAIRAELTKDLVINGEVEVEAKKIVAETQIVTPKGISNSTSRIILPEHLNKTEAKQIVLPKEFATPPQAKTEIILDENIRRRAAWETVMQRWQEMSISERRQLVIPQHLSAATKALLVLKGTVDAKQLKLRSDLPPKVKDLMSRLNWSRESGGSIEFRHIKPVSTPEAFHADRELFSDIAGIRRYIDDPSLPKPKGLEFSYHWHGSRHESSLDTLVPLEQRIRLIDLALIDRSDSVLANGLYGHDGMLPPVTLAQKDHIESRQHAENPRKEFDRIVRWMRLPESEAVAEAESYVNERSALLQAKALKSLNLDPDSKDLKNELKVLVKVDPNGLSKVLARADSIQWKLIIRTVIDSMDSKNIASLLPLIADKNLFTDNFSRILGKVLATMEKDGVAAFETAALNAGLNESETDSLLKSNLGSALKNSKWLGNSENYAAFLRLHGGSNLGDLILEGLSQCDGQRCLSSLLDTVELLKGAKPLLDAVALEKIQLAVRLNSQFIKIVGEARSGEFLFKEEIEVLTRYAIKSDSPALERLSISTVTDLSEKIRLAKKLIELNNSLSSKVIDVLKKDNYRQKELQELAKFIAARIATADATDAANLKKLTQDFPVKTTAASVAKAAADKAVSVCRKWFGFIGRKPRGLTP